MLLVPLIACAHIIVAGFGMPLVLAALAFGLLGDILLIPKGRVMLFGAGGASFFVGHVLYIVQAFMLGLPQLTAERFGAASAAACVLAAAAIAIPISAVIGRRLPKKLRAGLAVYAFGLSAMAAVMLCSFYGKPCPASGMLVLGGLLFVVSDTLLGSGIVGLVKGKRRGMWVMLTYILAQLGLAMGFALLYINS